MRQRLEHWRSKISEDMRADRQKSIILGVLLLILLSAAFYRWVTSGGAAPEPAVAEVAAVTPESPPRADASFAEYHEGPSEAQAARQREEAEEDAPPSPAITRNPFKVLNWSVFPAVKDASAVSEAELRFHQQAEELEQLQSDLEALQLQSTMTGVRPLAYISGRLVRVGDEVGGFSVVAIHDRRVTLERSRRRFELAMP